MKNWIMALVVPLGALVLAAAAPAAADDKSRDRSDRRIEHRFVDGKGWRHGGRHEARDRGVWHRDRGNRWDHRSPYGGRDGWRDRRGWQKDPWSGRQAARERARWERRAENLERRADILREHGRFGQAERLEREARRLERRADDWNRRDARRHDRRRHGPSIRWNSF